MPRYSRQISATHSTSRSQSTDFPGFGLHTTIAGGLHNSLSEALDKGCQTWQIFSRNPRSWSSRPLADEEIRQFRNLRQEFNPGPCLIHASYLINLAASTPDIREKSLLAFRDEIERCLAIGADYLVVHPGSARGTSPDQAIENCVRAIQQSALGFAKRMQKQSFQILIENTAGQGEQIGRSFEQVGEILAGCRIYCPEVPLGMCLDTAHSFAAGYDWRDDKATKDAIKRLHETVGIDQVRAIHFNDSKAAFGSQVDRHWHIGLGAIGAEGLARIVNHPKFRRLPFILETPQDEERDDRDNLAAARALLKP